MGRGSPQPTNTPCGPHTCERGPNIPPRPLDIIFGNTHCSRMEKRDAASLISTGARNMFLEPLSIPPKIYPFPKNVPFFKFRQTASSNTFHDGTIHFHQLKNSITKNLVLCSARPTGRIVIYVYS